MISEGSFQKFFDRKSEPCETIFLENEEKLPFSEIDFHNDVCANIKNFFTPASSINHSNNSIHANP
jgi:hypothetical protein